MTKEIAVALFAKKYEEWEGSSERMESGYKYEKSFEVLMQSVSNEVFALSLGRESKSKNTKKTSNVIR